MKTTQITFVVPFRNEEDFIEATLESLAQQLLVDIEAEVILVDGLSSDASRAIALRYVDRSTAPLRFRLVENPGRTTPAGFNLGLRLAESPLVGFGGAHTLYPQDYLQNAYNLLMSGVADIVGGGHSDILSSTDDLFSRTSVCLYTTPMGAGVASYHRRKTAGYVDTVYGGVYRRELFDKVGVFDEQLTKNQDNELNARITSAGYRIYFDPVLNTAYVQKTNFKAFMRRALNFGRFHPETWFRNPRSFRLRHAIPLIWTAYLGSLAVLEFIGSSRRVLRSPLLLYLILLLGSAANLSVKKRSPIIGLLSIPLFALYHFLYGLGTILGFGRLLGRKS